VDLSAWGCCCGGENVTDAASDFLITIVDNVAPVLEVELPDLHIDEIEHCDATETSQSTLTVTWDATDNCFDEVVVSVSHGVLPNGEQTLTATETYAASSIVWDLAGVDCEWVTLTVTAYDENCGVTEYATTFKVDNVAPVIENFRSYPEVTCGATNVELSWCITDECLVCGSCIDRTVGLLELWNGETSESYPVTAPCDCGGIECDTFIWEFGEIDCGTTLLATLTVWDTIGNEYSEVLEIEGADNKPPEVDLEISQIGTNLYELSWVATDNCFSLVSIWVSDGRLGNSIIYNAADVENYADQGESDSPVGTTTWDLTGGVTSETPVATLIAVDECCNESEAATVSTQQ